MIWNLSICFFNKRDVGSFVLNILSTENRYKQMMNMCANPFLKFNIAYNIWFFPVQMDHQVYNFFDIEKYFNFILIA